MSELASQQCKACKKGEAPLTRAQAENYLAEIDPGWSLNQDGTAIHRRYRFGNYYETMAFVNVAAAVAHQQDHHPDMQVTYNSCRIEYSTHSISGLSINDFICAAKTDAALKL